MGRGGGHRRRPTTPCERPHALAALALALVSCSRSRPAPGPGPEPQGADSEYARRARACVADPPINALCQPCPGGYAVENGKATCKCCAAAAADAGREAATGEICGGPPPN